MANNGHTSLNYDDNDSDLEMGVMEDVHVTPRKVHFQDDPRDDDDDELDIGGAEDGTRSLLGTERGTSDGMQRGVIVQQSRWSQMKGTVMQALPTLVFTTFGLLLTGELLEYVSGRRAMKTVDELIIIVPVILNLKGNLEMNLSARLGTAANMGDLDSSGPRREIVIGSMLLLQVQAIVVSFVAACVSFLLGRALPRKLPEMTAATDGTAVAELMSLLIRHPRPIKSIEHGHPPSGFSEFMIVLATSMASASLASLILGSFMCLLVLICRRLRLDPDNIAPPIAACLGDLVTLSLLGVVSSLLVFIGQDILVIPIVISLLLVLLGIGCTHLVRRNPRVRELLLEGWSPLFGAMALSLATGIVLDNFVSRYDGFAILAIMVGGLPGSVGSIFVSRLSTALHQAANIAPSATSPPPGYVKFGKNKASMPPNMRIIVFTLFLVTLPVEVLFLALMRVFGWVELPVTFLCFALVFFCCAVIASLVISQYLTIFLWSRGLDPDSYALPLQSSSIDLVGQLLLVACFEIAAVIGLHVSSVTSVAASIAS